MTTTAKTSLNSPLRIAVVSTPIGGGHIGMSLCPGKKQPVALSGTWDRDVLLDVRAIAQWGAKAMVTLMEQHELEDLSVTDLPAAVGVTGMRWVHLPIRDGDIPDAHWEFHWKREGPVLRQWLVQGGRIFLHCKGGLGRAGMVASRLLVELGARPEDAITAVRAARPGAIETAPQEDYVRRCSSVS